MPIDEHEPCPACKRRKISKESCGERTRKEGKGTKRTNDAENPHLLELASLRKTVIELEAANSDLKKANSELEAANSELKKAYEVSITMPLSPINNKQ